MENILLQEREQIRIRDKYNKSWKYSKNKYPEYFLKYYGLFKDENDKSCLLLKMESGRATLANILESGKKYQCEELSYVIEKLA